MIPQLGHISSQSDRLCRLGGEWSFLRTNGVAVSLLTNSFPKRTNVEIFNMDVRNFRYGLGF